MNRRLAISEVDLETFCRAHGIRRLSLFGSTLKGTAGPDSDVDLLVEFYSDRIPGLLGLAAMEDELSKMMHGRRVDLRTPNDLSDLFRESVLKEAELQYAA